MAKLVQAAGEHRVPHAAPMRRPQAPTPRRTERIQPPAEAAREEPESGITEQQIAAMLARLARSAT